jgi:hypothetical protein
LPPAERAEVERYQAEGWWLQVLPSEMYPRGGELVFAPAVEMTLGRTFYFTNEPAEHQREQRQSEKVA